MSLQSKETISKIELLFSVCLSLETTCSAVRLNILQDDTCRVVVADSSTSLFQSPVNILPLQLDPRNSRGKGFGEVLPAQFGTVLNLCSTADKKSDKAMDCDANHVRERRHREKKTAILRANSES